MKDTDYYDMRLQSGKCVFLQMDIRMRECRQHCLESSVAVLLPQLLHYSPSVEEWYHQMRSSLYLFSSLLQPHRHWALPYHRNHMYTNRSEYFTKTFWPCAVMSRKVRLHRFVFVDRLDPDTEQKSHQQWFPGRFRLFPAILPVELPLFILSSFSNSFVWTV